MEAAVRKIHDSQIFDSDNDFLRRLAYVESEFGNKKGVSLEDGGIWPVTKETFSKTQSDRHRGKRSIALKRIHVAIETVFGIRWQKVSWPDLIRPFYSALAARIALWQLPEDIPEDWESQVKFFVKYYGDGSTGFDLRHLFWQDCQINAKTDIIFALDASQRIGSDFSGILDNLVELVPVFPKKTSRFGVLVYSKEVRQMVPLVNNLTKAEIVEAIKDVRQGDFNDTSNLENAVIDAVAQFRNMSGTLGSQGEALMRCKVPLVLVLMTDGNYDEDPQAALAEARKEGIYVIAYGVGDRINLENLFKIAAQPEDVIISSRGHGPKESMSKLIRNINSLSQVIESEKVTDFLRKDTKRFYRVLVFNETIATVWLEVEEGDCWGYWAVEGQPSPALYDDSFSGHKELVFLGDPVGSQAGSLGPHFGPESGPRLRTKEDPGSESMDVREFFVTVACTGDDNKYRLGVEDGDHKYPFNRGLKKVWFGFVVLGALAIFGGLGWIFIKQGARKR